MPILVFKTNIRYKKEVQTVQHYIGKHPGIVKWNVDLKDCDKVLRVVGNVPPVVIENIVQNLGYVCEELT